MLKLPADASMVQMRAFLSAVIRSDSSIIDLYDSSL